jgi:hypothetical protein
MRLTPGPVRLLLACVLLLAMADVASADITAFIGTTTTPSARQARGVAIGAGLLFLGFEFEYSQTSEDAEEAAPGLKTGMGNVLLQTPVPIAGITPYFTTGAGIFRERLGEDTETSFGVNTGGGAKIRLAGPLRVRLDYRVFTLRGSPRYDIVHRLYVGANIAF